MSRKANSSFPNWNTSSSVRVSVEQNFKLKTQPHMKFNQSLLPFQAEFTAENRDTRVTANTISEDVGSRWPLKLRRRFDSSSVMCRESHGDKNLHRICQRDPCFYSDRRCPGPHRVIQTIITTSWGLNITEITILETKKKGQTLVNLHRKHANSLQRPFSATFFVPL